MGHAGSPKRSIIPKDMSALPKAGSVALNHAVEALAWAAPARRDQVTFKRRDVRLLAPFRRLPTFRDGNLFEGHTRNAPQFATTIAPQWYHVPAYYKGTPAWIGGPDDPLRWPEPTERLDFDGEYTPVMARRQREIAPADAWTQVAGLINPNRLQRSRSPGERDAAAHGTHQRKEFSRWHHHRVVPRYHRRDR